MMFSCWWFSFKMGKYDVHFIGAQAVLVSWQDCFSIKKCITWLRIKIQTLVSSDPLTWLKPLVRKRTHELMQQTMYLFEPSTFIFFPLVRPVLRQNMKAYRTFECDFQCSCALTSPWNISKRFIIMLSLLFAGCPWCSWCCYFCHEAWSELGRYA